jgi:hypothetical protein
MKWILILLFISCSATAMTWVTGSSIQVVSPSPSEGERVVFFNSYTKNGPKINVWETVDLSGLVPDNTTAAHLTGVLIISHGSSQETADMRLYFRCDSDYDPTGTYKHQVVEASVLNGQRSTMSTWVCLNDLKFEYKWETGSPLGEYPEKSAYGANLAIDAIIIK